MAGGVENLHRYTMERLHILNKKGASTLALVPHKVYIFANENKEHAHDTYFSLGTHRRGCPYYHG